MCFSAQVECDLQKLSKTFDAEVDEQAFAELLEERLSNRAIKISKALEANFLAPQSPIQERITANISQYKADEVSRLEAELFEQKKRLADAQRKLAVKETKAAREHQRISSNKIKWSLAKLSELRRDQLEDKDARIFPFMYAPVVVQQQGRTLIKPMRYHCRQASKPANYDRRFNGLYNARRDNLRKFWKPQFGHDHALLVMTSFYENVAKHDFEQRSLAEGEPEENLVLQFTPEPAIPMVVACLWSHWERDGEKSLDSFAAVTDEPPPEIAETGHDRCVIILDSQRAHEWLTPQGRPDAELDEIMDSRPQLVHRHALAA